MPCTWEFDSPTTGSKSLVRGDTGETVRVEVMEGDDLQLTLLPDAMPEDRAVGLRNLETRRKDEVRPLQETSYESPL